MPTMANIVVKNAANADVTFTAAAGSSGDKIPAVWLNNASSTIRANRQKATMEVHNSGASNSRVATGVVEIPYIVTVDGQEVIVAKMVFKNVNSQPKTIPDSVQADAVTVAMNFFASALYKQAVAESLSPRG